MADIVVYQHMPRSLSVVKLIIKGYNHYKGAFTQLKWYLCILYIVCSILSDLFGGHIGFQDGRHRKSQYLLHVNFYFLQEEGFSGFTHIYGDKEYD